jgi:hypothetical protein
VAGTIENFVTTLSYNLDAGDARELQQNPASHTSALGELFIADEWGGVQEEVCEVDSGHCAQELHPFLRGSELLITLGKVWRSFTNDEFGTRGFKPSRQCYS